MTMNPAQSSADPFVLPNHPRRWSVVFALGLLAFVVPTMIDVARASWSTEQGAHGPIVLVTGIWLLWGELRHARIAYRPGSAALTAWLLVPLLILFTIARIAGLIEIEGFAMYTSLIVMAYALWGAAPLRLVWFPLIYLLFRFPAARHPVHDDHPAAEDRGVRDGGVPVGIAGLPHRGIGGNHRDRSVPDAGGSGLRRAQFAAQPDRARPVSTPICGTGPNWLIWSC